MPGKLLITDELKMRVDAFTVPARFRMYENLEGYAKAVPFVLSKKLEITTPYELYDLLDCGEVTLETLSDDIIGAGFSLSDDSFSFLKKAVSCGIPSVLLSPEECSMESIHVEYLDDSVVLTSQCGCSDGINERCFYNQSYCNDVSDPESKIHKKILEIVEDPLFSKKGSGTEIVFPVFKYSLFLSLISWRSHLGRISEQVQIERAKKRNKVFKKALSTIVS